MEEQEQTEKGSVPVASGLLEWFEGRAEIMGLDAEDLVDYVLTAYMKKTDPRRTLDVSGRKLAAMGVSKSESQKFVSVVIERILWERFKTRGRETRQDPAEMVGTALRQFLDQL
ncbi:MAG: hypothetical protein CSA22_01605 [Deltaproteobacteria bacterium]|nr:MAG: hypothetical protein CSA22_01605 [Deltaproteobacteria bacterium]